MSFEKLNQAVADLMQKQTEATLQTVAISNDKLIAVTFKDLIIGQPDHMPLLCTPCKCGGTTLHCRTIGGFGESWIQCDSCKRTVVAPNMIRCVTLFIESNI